MPHTRNCRCKNLLLTRSCIVPERVDEVVVGGQSLVVPNELQTRTVNWGIDFWIPTLRGHAHVFEEH